MAGTLVTTVAVLCLVGAVKAAMDLPSPLKLNLEELAQVNECSEYKELSSPDRSLDYRNETIDKCDAELTPGWYRFTDSAGSHMATRCVTHHYCSAINPGWLNGSHPEVYEGVVGRRVCFKNDESCCYGSMKVLVRNCGDFFVYMLFGIPCPFRYCGSHRPPTPAPTTPRPPSSALPTTTEATTTEATTTAATTTAATTTATTLPPFPQALKSISDECHNYIPLTSEDRSAGFYNPFTGKGDYKLITGWYRFMGKAGSKMADNCIPRFHCGTHAPGWLLGGHPSEATNHVVERTACFHWKENCCYFRQDILVRSCEGYFVYKLKKNPFKFLRYCGNGIEDDSEGNDV